MVITVSPLRRILCDGQMEIYSLVSHLVGTYHVTSRSYVHCSRPWNLHSVSLLPFAAAQPPAKSIKKVYLEYCITTSRGAICAYVLIWLRTFQSVTFTRDGGPKVYLLHGRAQRRSENDVCNVAEPIVQISRIMLDLESTLCTSNNSIFCVVACRDAISPMTKEVPRYLHGL